MSVTGEFERYLSTLIELLREGADDAQQRALLASLEVASQRGQNLELSDRAARVLEALESHAEADAGEESEATQPGRLRKIRKDLEAISRIVLGK